MVEMAHILSLGFPVSRNDFSPEDWQLYAVWRREIDDEVDRRRELQRAQNAARRRLGQKPKEQERY